MPESPQVENGFTRIANEIMEALCSHHVSGDQMRCLLFIIRKTYGWHRKTAEISLNEFVQATGILKPHVCRALGIIEKMNLIFVTKNGNKSNATYQFNKRYQDWKSLPKLVTPLPKLVTPLPKLVTKTNKQPENIRKNDIITKIGNENIVTKIGNETLPKLVTNASASYSIKENKEILPLPPLFENHENHAEPKNGCACEFEKFWNAYPKKIQKIKAQHAWSEMNGQKPDIEVILKAIEVWKRSDAWTQYNGRYIPTPANWLLNGQWDDEPVVTITNTQPQSIYREL